MHDLVFQQINNMRNKEEGDYKLRDLKEIINAMFKPCTDPNLHNIR